jgi:hypothetical protein
MFNALELFVVSCGAGYQWDYVFDWTILKYQQLQQQQQSRVETTYRRQDNPAGGYLYGANPNENLDGLGGQYSAADRRR